MNPRNGNVRELLVTNDPGVVLLTFQLSEVSLTRVDICKGKPNYNTKRTSESAMTTIPVMKE